MKNRLTKILAFALSLALLLSLPMAASAEGEAIISFGEAIGKPGAEVEASVSISGNRGISSFMFEVSYDAEVFTFLSAANGEMLTKGSLLSQEKGGKITLMWFSVDGDITADGELMRLKFAINDSAEGDYALGVRYLPADILNEAGEQVPLLVENGSICIGYIVAGKVKSQGEGEAQVRLLQNGEELQKSSAKDGAYSFGPLPAGAYSLEFSKKDHGVYRYDFSFDGADRRIDPVMHLLGDANGNGRVSIADAVMVLRFCAGNLPVGCIDRVAADVSAVDAEITTLDAVMLLKHLMGNLSIYS